MIVALLLALGACGDDAPADPPDAAPDADAEAPRAAPEDPAPPNPVDWGECPRGFAPIEEGTARLCSPGELADPTIGSTCPSGAYRDDVTGTRVDRDLDAAIAAATPPAILSLAKGGYTLAAAIPAGIEIVGACAGETTIALGRSIDVRGALRDVTLTFADEGALHVPAEASVRFEDIVAIGDADGTWFPMQGAASFERFLVSGGFSHAMSGLSGSALTLRQGWIVGPRVESAIFFAGDRIELSKLRIEAARGLALSITDAEVEASDVIVVAQRGAELESCSARLARYRSTGGPSTAIDVIDGQAEIVDLETEGLESPSPLPGGEGVICEGCDLVLGRARLARSRFSALTFVGGTGMVEDVAIVDVGGLGQGRAFGFGLIVEDAARVEAQRLRVDRARAVGVLATGEDSSLTLDELQVRETVGAACVLEECRIFPGGVGLGVYAQARVEVSRFSITLGRMAGVQVARAGELDLADGVVTGNPVGVNVQDGADIQRLQRSVDYTGNTLTLDTQSLPVPDLALP